MHRGHAVGRGAPRRVDHDQQLHQVVRRSAGRLDHEDVAAADVLVDLDRDLAVGEAPDLGLAEPDLQVPAELLRQHPVRRSREDPQRVHQAPTRPGPRAVPLRSVFRLDPRRLADRASPRQLPHPISTLPAGRALCWLGREDSNLRMREPKSRVLAT